MVTKSVFELTVKEADEILNLGPTMVSENDLLKDIVAKVTKNPVADVISVVGSDDVLVGVIPLSKIEGDVFRELIPEDFLSEGMVLGKVLRFFKELPVTARELMDRLVCVRLDETVSDAFIRMHNNNLSGIPIVPEKNTVVGYLSMIELLALWLKAQERPKGDTK
ncbi:MAG: CBS domain-containing protein [Bacteroidota bacterium]